MRSIIALILVGIIGTAVWNYKGTKPRNDSSFIDSAKYVAITYPENPACKDQYGNYPDTTVASDFDGDGKLDRVRIAKKDATHDVLVVWLSSKDYQPLEIEQIPDHGSMTISLVKSGETVKNESKSVTLKNDSFRYGKCGNTPSVFYWNPETAMLDRN